MSTMWTVETQVGGRWHRLVTDRRGYCEGLYAGLTDYTRTSTPIRLVRPDGTVERESRGGGVQVGMETTPYPEAAWVRLAREIAATTEAP